MKGNEFERKFHCHSFTLQKFKSKTHFMKSISIWAKSNIWQSRMLIIVIYIFLNGIGITTGMLLSEINIHLPYAYFMALILITIILWINYPDKHQKRSFSSTSFYVRRKTFDFLLGTVTFLFIVYAGNHLEQMNLETETATASVIVPLSKDSAILNHPLLKDFISSLKNREVSKLSQREKIKLIKKQIKAINRDSGTSKSDKTLLLILSILIAIGLISGLAALSCSIACGGAEALAVIVFAGGLFLIIFFLVRFIKHLNKPILKKEESKVLEK